ncbi:MAG: hypothetical protein AAF556_10350, partial [Pseudomonadota bacterium]
RVVPPSNADPFDQLSDGEQRQLNKPTPERIRQGFAERAPFRAQDQKVFDSQGEHVYPVGRVVDVLDRWLRKDEISQGQHEAGMLYQELFQASGMHFSPACDPGRIPSGGGDPEAGMVRAIDRAHDATQAYNHLGGDGSPIAQAIRMVLGEGMLLNDYAARHCPAKCRRTAKDRVISGLAILAHYWRRDDAQTA